MLLRCFRELGSENWVTYREIATVWNSIYGGGLEKAKYNAKYALAAVNRRAAAMKACPMICRGCTEKRGHGICWETTGRKGRERRFRLVPGQERLFL